MYGCNNAEQSVRAKVKVKYGYGARDNIIYLRSKYLRMPNITSRQGRHQATAIWSRRGRRSTLTLLLKVMLVLDGVLLTCYCYPGRASCAVAMPRWRFPVPGASRSLLASPPVALVPAADLLRRDPRAPIADETDDYLGSRLQPPVSGLYLCTVRVDLRTKLLDCRDSLD